MQLTYVFPAALWLLPLLPLLWALTLMLPRRIGLLRLWCSLVLRTLLVLTLIMALAGAQIVRDVHSVTTVFLLDGSDSVPPVQRARAEAYIQQSLATMPPDHQAAVVVFGQRALVERAPSNERTFGRITTQPGGSATNLQDAVQLGLALLPAEGYQRLVLLSDGAENIGEAREASRRAALRGVPIDVVALSGPAEGFDAQISAVGLPAAARAGQRLRMTIDIASSGPAQARIQVQQDGVTLLDQPAELVTGPQRIELQLPETQPAFNRYVVRVDTPDDARPENNVAEAYTLVSGHPQILIIEGTAGEAAAFAKALESAQVKVSTVQAARAPATIGELVLYDAVALVNVPRHKLTDQTMVALNSFVHDLGHGLLMVGGPDSFGAGGWRDTPVEEALPVTMNIPTQLQLPSVSVVLVIDISGSMSDEEDGRTKLSLAVEGAQRIASLLRDEDELTVIPFDNHPYKVVGPLPGSQRQEAIEALNNVQIGGGGINIHDALREAERYVRRSEKPVRHIITITDGADTTQQEGALDIVRALHDERVTLTSIAIGDGNHVPFIRDMAGVGGGRTFLAEQASTLPTILVNEAQQMLQPYVQEKTFTPARGVNHPILRNISATPTLHGFVLTTPRQTAQLLLVGPDDAPILAAWQYGLGHSLAWTSDLSGRWGRDWITWQEFPRISGQLLAWLLPAPGSQNLTLETSVAGGELVLNAEALTDRGGSQSGLQVLARMISADGTANDVTLREVSPGKYRATVRGDRPGAYLVQLVALDKQGRAVGSATAGAVVPMSAEYRGGAANPGLLEQVANETGGRVEPLPTTTFDTNTQSRGAVREIGLPLLWLALLLLPLDIAIRRIMLTPEQSAKLHNLLFGWLPQYTRTIPPTPEPVQPEDTTPRAGWGQRLSLLLTRRSRAEHAITPELERLREAQERARKRARGEE